MEKIHYKFVRLCVMMIKVLWIPTNRWLDKELRHMKWSLCVGKALMCPTKSTGVS
jgi:hypothetical protein